MLLYTLFSDILTVIPLAIKGAELVYIGGLRHRTIAVRMTSAMNGTLSNSAGASLWAAECRATKRVRPLGFAFLTIALVFLTLGVWLEFWARQYVKMRERKRRVQAEEEISDSFVRPDEHYDVESYVLSVQERRSSTIMEGSCSWGWRNMRK